MSETPKPFMEEYGYDSSGWVHRAAERPAEHACAPPRREAEETTIAPFGTVPDGAEGDIWRCGCGQHWLVGEPPPITGIYAGGWSLAWRPITARRARRLVRRAERRAR